jgi:hypothetical protein
MIIGLPQSMIIEVSRACRAITPAGAGLGQGRGPAEYRVRLVHGLVT